jgi:hypothetical protein
MATEPDPAESPRRPPTTPIVAPPPPPPSEATRRVIIPDTVLDPGAPPPIVGPPPPPPPAPPPPPPPPSATEPPGRRALVAVGAVVVLALVALGVVLLTKKDDAPRASISSAPQVDPASADPTNLQPGRPPGVDDPPAPASPSPMVALRQSAHVGFERVAVDFGDTLPPRVQAVEPDAALGRIRVVLDQPRPTKAQAPVRLDVPDGVVASVFFVVDADRTYVDVFTEQAVDAIVFRLGNVAFTDGSVRGSVVIDIVPSATAGTWGGAAVIGSGGVLRATAQGQKLHVEGYGVRTSGKGIVRLLDGTNAEVRKLTVVLTAAAPVNGVFSADVDLTGVAKGSYTIEFTSDNGGDDIDGRAPSTSAIVTVP